MPMKHDEIDELAADPIVDRIGNRRTSREVSRVLDIIDELEREGGGR